MNTVYRNLRNERRLSSQNSPITRRKTTAILEQRNARIIAYILDGHQTNKSLWAVYGITGEEGRVKNWISHPTVEGFISFFISDVPHLMKCI